MTAPAVAATAARGSSTAASAGGSTRAASKKPGGKSAVKSIGGEIAKAAAARAITGGGGKKRNTGSAGKSGQRGKTGSSATTTHRFLIAELMLCIVVIGLSPMVAKQSGKDFMKRGSAILATFAILGMISSIGPKSGKAVVAFGGLITLGIFIDQRSLFGKVASVLSSGRIEAEPDGPIGGEIIQTV